MKQENFESAHQLEWQAFEHWLTVRKETHRKKKIASSGFADHEVPQRYRQLCQHLSLARDRDYGLALVEHLHRLVQEGHDALYGPQSGFGMRVLRYATGGFAADVRANARWVLASALLLFGPMLAVMAVVRARPDFAYFIVSPEQVASFEAMYSFDAHVLGRVARDASTDVSMFGFYINNNIGIAFRCFAGGMTAGLLTALALIYNGLMMGVVEARLVNAGLGENFYSFVVGHSTFELGAIMLAGAAGLRLGAAIVAPGRLTRGAALRRTARSLVGIVCGLAVMLLAAALVEAFWSPLRLALPLKLSVGGALCVLTFAYFIFAGRADEH
ncbi:MAG TPA: stage II sporulation protein M [Rhodocyclaceae bacterium]|nr:stage II sporulation protein M [Rhodocyclaceae bacterium]